MFTIYGKNECPMCFKVKVVLEMMGKEYEYKELDNLLYHLSKHIREEDEVVVTQDL